MQHGSVPEQALDYKSISSTTEIYYPESDGKPLAETGFHVSAIAYLHSALRFLFRQQPNIYTSACLLFYYEEGNPTAFKVPDLFVVKGIAKHNRRTFKLWKEKVVPCTVIEITSNDTRDEDNGEKKELYQALGIKEYFLFDPLNEYLEPCLQGLHLKNGRYELISPAKDGALISHELDIILRPTEDLLRVVNPITGWVFPTIEEAADILAAQQRLKATETELARVRAELEQLKRQKQTGASSQ